MSTVPGEEVLAALRGRYDAARLDIEEGRVDQAIEALRSLIDDVVALVGEDGELARQARSELAQLLGDKGRFAEAAAVLEPAVASLVRTAGPRHIETVQFRYGLAGILILGGLPGAVAFTEALLEDHAAEFGVENPYTLGLRKMLVAALAGSGRVDEAVASMRRLLEDAPDAVSVDSPVLPTAVELASMLVAQGAFAEALEIVEPLMPGLAAAHGPDHEQTIIAKMAVAKCYSELGLGGPAVALSREIVAALTTRAGATSFVTLCARDNLAAALRQAGELQEAVRVTALAADDSVRVLGAADRLSVQLRGNLEILLGDAADEVATSTGELEDLLLTSTTSLGEDSPVTLWLRHNLAMRIARSGRTADAIEQMVQIVEDMERLCDAGFPPLRRAREDLAGLRDEIQPGADG